jgi:hypothetical protein
MQNFGEAVDHRQKMRTQLKNVVISIAIALVAGVASLAFVCRSKTINEQASPGSDYVAKLEQSDCGATTRFETDVTIVATKPRLGLGVFGHASENVFTFTGSSSQVRVHWESAAKLVVECTKCDPKNVHLWRGSWHEVTIRYAPG